MIFSTIFLFTRQGVSQKSYDSLKIETPKHYFNTLLVIDGYGKPSKNMKDTADVLNKRLKSYGVKQVNLSFCTPLYTKDEYSKDSSRISNHHILLTGNYNVLKPIFSGISDHKLVKLGIGIQVRKAFCLQISHHLLPEMQPMRQKHISDWQVQWYIATTLMKILIGDLESQNLLCGAIVTIYLS